jgi:hypothetical protein
MVKPRVDPQFGETREDRRDQRAIFLAVGNEEFRHASTTPCGAWTRRWIATLRQNAAPRARNQAFDPVIGGRAARLHLRHRHRRGRDRRLRLSRIRADLDGRHQAAEPRSPTKAAAANFRSTATSRARSGRPRISPMPAARSGPRPAGIPNSPTSTAPACSTSSSPRTMSRRCRLRGLRSRQSAARPVERQIRENRRTSRHHARSARRGALIADFNLDGALDLLVVNRAAPASLFRNLGADAGGGGTKPMGNWIEIRLVEPKPNRNGSAPSSPSRRERGRRRAPYRSAATPPAMRAGCMSVSAPPSARIFACKGPTANAATPTAPSPINSWSSTGPSRRRNIGTRGGRGGRQRLRSNASRFEMVCRGSISTL